MNFIVPHLAFHNNFFLNNHIDSPEYGGIHYDDDYEDADVLKKKKRSAHGLIFHPLQEIEDRRKKECEPWWMCESSDLGNYKINHGNKC